MEYFHYKIITSTSDYAKILLENNDEVIVTADYQTAGRGRNRNTWVGSDYENVFLSYGINHFNPINFKQAALYQAIGCLAVSNTLRKCNETVSSEPASIKQPIHISNTTFKIKYPNDIYACYGVQQTGTVDVWPGTESSIHSTQSKTQNSYQYKKISGVLTEHGFMGENCIYSIVGIGINVNQTAFPDELKEKATSLKLLNISVDLNKLINLLIDEIIILKKMNFNDIFELWSKELNIINNTVVVKDKPGNWNIRKLLPDSRLLAVEVNTGEQLIIEDGDSLSYKL